MLVVGVTATPTRRLQNGFAMLDSGKFITPYWQGYKPYQQQREPSRGANERVPWQTLHANRSRGATVRHSSMITQLGLVFVAFLLRLAVRLMTVAARITQFLHLRAYRLHIAILGYLG